MANALSTRIRELSISKLDLADDIREGHAKAVANEILDLDDASDEFVVLAGGDAEQEDIAGALVDLADVFDDLDLSPDQTATLDGVVDRLLKTGTKEQKDGAKTLFHKVLAYSMAIKAERAYLDSLLEA